MIPCILFLLLVSIPPFHAISFRSNCTGSTYAVNSTYQTNLNTLLSSLTAKSSFFIYSNATIGTSPNRIYGHYVCQGDLSPSECQKCVQSATANLNTLLSSLTAKSSFFIYSNATIGTSPNRIYGHYVCQGDLSPSECQKCVQSATANNSCPSSRQAVIWYDYCMLRYSDANFFGVPDTDGIKIVNGDKSLKSPVPYQMMSNLIKIAPFRLPMFAANASMSTDSYTMAQCTDDLTPIGCSQCLNTLFYTIKYYDITSIGWRYMTASCKIRYEAYAFLYTLDDTYTQIVESTCSANNLPSSSKPDSLLSYVTSKAAPTGFYNDTQSEFFGLALCRADISSPSDDCNNCLTLARTTLTTDYCPNNTQGTVWYEKCMVRYSNESFFGVVDYGGKSYCGVKQISDEAGSDNVVFVTALIGVAAKSTLMFAANDTGVGSALVQCGRDMSSEGCESCLQKGMNVVNRDCKQTNGWRYLSGSCTIRYEEYVFFNISAIGIGAPAPQFAPQPLLPQRGGGEKQNSSKKVPIILGPVLGAILLGILLYLSCCILKRRNAKSIKLDGSGPFDLPSNMDLLFLDLATIQAATGNFSNANKLGEGGFGPVYKGTLSGGREIAVKRLSVKSKQGASEFKNEVKLIARLQHRNLVRVLGCCAEGEEQLLIYEYLPNKSLDAFLFDENKRSQLDWTSRHLIIAGIARGLLYLHEDSLLKVIHRDLKSDNVLLDNSMNPKISDFGMAKIFETGVTDVNTGRVVGTFGYMAPEYAMNGIFSEKSDVYSFGVLLLEIVSGQKNGRSHFEQHGQTLLRHAWQLWSGNTAMELIDILLGDSYPQAEAMRVIHIGLLCVQENVEERPTMSSVVLMLRSDQMVYPQPTQPPTFTRIVSPSKGHSVNEVTITELTPR